MVIPKRVFIYGVCGSGKTTLAKRVSEKTGLPWHSVDDLTWLPNWEEVPVDDQRAKIHAICEAEQWILDTAYSKWLDIPMAHAEQVIALDYPHWVSFLRLVRRTVLRAVDKKPICNGNHENWKLMFSRKSIILWNLHSFRSKQRRIAEMEQAGMNVLRLKSPKQAEQWVQSLEWCA